MTPLMILGLLGIVNIAIFIVYVYTHNTIRNLAGFIDAFVVTTSVVNEEENNEHDEILRTAVEEDFPHCVALLGALLRVPQVLYGTMIALAVFWWTLSVGNFVPFVAIVTAGLQAYGGLLLFNMAESLYTIVSLERKYIQLEAHIFNDDE